MTNIQQNKYFSIDVGPLRSIGSFYLHVARRLPEYNNLFREGKAPVVEWDLTNVSSPSINMAALTAFISLAARLRKFTEYSHVAKINWQPKTFGFWHDISFFELVKNLDLFKWPEGMVGGYESEKTNPHSKILIYPYIQNEIPNKNQLNLWKEWKDSTREMVKEDLLLRCNNLFAESQNIPSLPTKLKTQIAVTSSELVVNSLLHGNETAFVGLQRTSKRISVVVSDCGRGFLSSLHENFPTLVHEKQIKNNIESLIFGSLINKHEFGLKQAITDVVNIENSSVSIYSCDTEIHWKKDMWDMALELSHDNNLLINDIIGKMPTKVTKKPSYEEMKYGFYRIWREGIRGARVCFEISVE